MKRFFPLAIVPLLTFAFFSVWPLPQSEALRGSRLKLSCEHLNFIQSQYLENHITHSKFNRNLENRLIEQYVKSLDRGKMYLRDSDIKEIKAKMKGIYKKTRSRNCEPIQQAHEIFKKRVAERVAFVNKTLTDKFKLDKTVELKTDPDERKYPRTVAEQNRFHTKYLHFQMANYITSDMKPDEAREKIKKNYERIQKRIGEDDLEDIYATFLDAFARALDPHSSFFSWDAVEDFQIQMSLSLEGIGATLSSKDGFTTIEQLIAGGAAAQSGKLKPKDKIVAVAQEDDKKFKPADNVIDMDLRDVVRKIRGKKGTKVKLSILRKEGKENKKFDVVLVRDKIKLEDEAAQIHYIEKTIKGQKKTVGLINLPSFYADNRSQDGRSAAKDMKKLLAEARKKKVDAVVLDFSTNGGGSLDDAVKIAGLFFKTGNVVKQSQKSPTGSPIVLADLDPAVDYSGPLVVLTSRISASASEIVAGTLKDYKRAIVVGGDHTFGKGSVQSVSNLPRNLGALKTTVGMFFTAGGASTQHRGVDADIVFPSTLSTDEIGEKNLDYSLPPKRVKRFLSKDAYVRNGSEAWSVVNKGLIKDLNAKSQARIKKNEEFTKIKKDIKKAKDRGKVIKVSELFEEEKDDDKKDKDHKDDEDYTLTKEEKLKKYLERADIQEAINVAADFVEMVTLNSMATTGEPKKEARLGQ
ncbi:MAG: tail-specific protease [Bdellovibrionaceae bacterium]|nr:tail-specific protease [Pseudobdellovibrionaceae bacterium]|tara:strand:+ start:52040 stop:54118 length:2079 start_codon:yes stop_codon:yes gene_type:complete